MRQLFNVAGHYFVLNMPDDNPMWREMKNYAPFRIAHTTPDLFRQSIFTINVCKDIPQGEPKYLGGSGMGSPDATFIKIYTHADGYLFEMRVNAMDRYPSFLWLNSEFTSGVLKDCDRVEYGRFAIDNAMMLAFALRTAREQTLEMHASVVVKNGYGYLFLGQSGAGKSTHSRMWLENIPGCKLLNDDNPIVRIVGKGEVMVYGSPWSGKTSCYINRNCKVGAFVRIVKYPSNEIGRMTLLEAYGTMFESCSGMRLDTQTNDSLHTTIEAVLGKIPFWKLRCLPDAEAAQICYSSVKNGDTVTSK